MADQQPPLSVQSSNQKTDGLDIDNDEGEKEACGATLPIETSDMEEGEILTTDDETVDNLNDIRQQLEQELGKEENLGQLQGENEAEDLLDVEKAAETSTKLGINFGLLAECKKINTDKAPSSKKSDSSKHDRKIGHKDNRDGRSRSESRREHDRKKSNEKSNTNSDRDQRKSNERTSSRDDRSRDRKKSNDRTPSKGDNQRDWGRRSNDKVSGKGNTGRDSYKVNDTGGSMGRHRRDNDRGNRSRDARSQDDKRRRSGGDTKSPEDKSQTSDSVRGTSKNHNSQGKTNDKKDDKDRLKSSTEENKTDFKECPFKTQTIQNEKVEACNIGDTSVDSSSISSIKRNVQEEDDSDKIDEVLDNLEEMTCSSSSENEKVSKSDGEVSADTPANIKRKHSTENIDKQNQDSLEPPNKKSKVDDGNADEDNDEENFDDTRAFHSAQEFQIIDDIGNDEQEMEEKESENDERLIITDGGDNVDDGEYVSSDELDDNEIYSWLEDGINKKSITKGDFTNLEPVDMKEKFVLIEKGTDPFEVLPEGWVCVTHNSGMPTYLHKASRVVTLSKPYFLGSGSVRRHDIPVSAIPCLQYKKQLLKEKNLPATNYNQQLDAQCESGAIVESQSGASQPTQPLLNGGLSGKESGQVGEEMLVDTSQTKQPAKLREAHMNAGTSSLPNAETSPCPQIHSSSSEERLMSEGSLASSVENAQGQSSASSERAPSTQAAVNGTSSAEGKEVSGDESSEQKESSQDDTTDLDKTLTFDEKGEDSSCLDTTKTEGERLTGGQMPGPPVKIESVAEKKIENSVPAEELQAYCRTLFEFKSVTVKKFKTWRERRKHLNAIRRKKSRPALPAKTKLITCEIPMSNDCGPDKPKKKEFVLNPAGKSPVCILHEYAQHTLKIQPRYRFLELENAQNPYSAIVLINNVEYGKGFASSKKLAKMNAAKETLRILIPEMTKIWDEADDLEDMSFFDEIKVEDPRVSDLCTKTGQPSPYQILLECLKRNYGMGDTHVKIDVKPLKHQKSEYTLTVGKHSVTIVCKNKREGKQRAAQAMLQQLHPHITCIGSLLRLYGQSFGRELKEKKKEEESVTELQTHTQANRPNIALLDKLRKEMSKLQAQKTAVTSKGSLLIDKVPTGITSLDL